MEQLKNIIQNAQCDLDTFSLIRRHAQGILVHLGMDSESADLWLQKNIKNKKIEDFVKWEEKLHSDLEKQGIYKNLSQRMTDRSHEWFVKIEPHLLKSKTLDLGGGSGEVANLMKDFGCDVTVADALNWLKFNLPYIKVVDNKTDVPNGAFDQVVVLTVFHHTNNVPALLAEAFRVAKKRVIFIESVTENLSGYEYGAWIDWFYNHIIHYSLDVDKKINVPCNFQPATSWEQLVWKLTGLKPNVSINIGIYQFLNPENHHLFVYNK